MKLAAIFIFIFSSLFFLNRRVMMSNVEIRENFTKMCHKMGAKKLVFLAISTGIQIASDERLRTCGLERSADHIRLIKR